MSKRFFLLMLALQFVLTHASHANQQPLAISIHAITASAKDGVEVGIDVKNVSNGDVRFGVTSGGIGDTLSKTFKVDVKRGDGSPVPMTHAGEVAYRGLSGADQDPNEQYKYAIESVSQHLLHPGQTKSFVMNVSSLFDMSKPGSYVVQLTRQSPVFSENVSSNLLQVEVR